MVVLCMLPAAHMLDVGQNEYSRGMSPSPGGHHTPQPPRSPQPMGNNRGMSAQQAGRGHPNLTVVIPNSRGEVPNSAADHMVSEQVQCCSVRHH